MLVLTPEAKKLKKIIEERFQQGFEQGVGRTISAINMVKNGSSLDEFSFWPFLFSSPFSFLN